MARIYNKNTIAILEAVSASPDITSDRLFKLFDKQLAYKDFYNTLFRLTEQELLKKQAVSGKTCYTVTTDGKKIVSQASPVRDGVWKLVIFDIPEKQKYVRAVLRAKLKTLHFKKWQNSIWASPFALDEEIEQEFKELSKKFFVRLIKVKEINRTDDLEKMFE